jgi:hypothetical protein
MQGLRENFYLINKMDSLNDFQVLKLAQKILESSYDGFLTDECEHVHPLGVLIFLQDCDGYECNKILFINQRGESKEFNVNLPCYYRIRSMSTALVFEVEEDSTMWYVVPFMFHKGVVHTEVMKMPILT